MNDRGPMGVAPKLLPYALPPLAVAVGFQLWGKDLVAFEGPLRGLAFSLGLWLGLLALIAYADIALRLISALKRKTLADRGSYAVCRHPLFAWWIFLLLPTLMLLLDNWIFAVVSLCLTMGVFKHGPTEEAWLEESFADEYRSYVSRTRFILPIPRWKALGKHPILTVLAILCSLAVFSLLAYIGIIKPAMTRFGATGAELSQTYPGDDWIRGKSGGFTQAITIDAPPEAVWPWLVQVGYRKAGWYNIDAINGLSAKDYFFEGSESARRIIGELQDLEVGDSVYLVPAMGLQVKELKAPHLMVLVAGSPDQGKSDQGKPAAVSWCFLLQEDGKGGTRFISRFRSEESGLGLLLDAIVDAVSTLGGAVLQQPAMLYGIKTRAEGRLR